MFVVTSKNKKDPFDACRKVMTLLM
jgi:hypothetical protein